MFVTERVINIVAPHYCMVCGMEGAVLCDWCLPDFAHPLPARCYRCLAATQNSKVCAKCRRKSPIGHVWVRTQYEGQVKQLIHDFKFERKQAAAEPIAQLMSESLPYLPKETIVVHIPTASRRVRVRGYDHAELLAKALATKLGLRHQTLLRRVTQTRQVGAKREERLKQMESAFLVVEGIPKRSQVLLVDDLVTTGSTLESAGRLLRDSGVKTINAVVFAQK
jgi:ComF family protein